MFGADLIRRKRPNEETGVGEHETDNDADDHGAVEILPELPDDHEDGERDQEEEGGDGIADLLHESRFGGLFAVGAEDGGRGGVDEVGIGDDGAELHGDGGLAVVQGVVEAEFVRGVQAVWKEVELALCEMCVQAQIEWQSWTKIQTNVKKRVALM